MASKKTRVAKRTASRKSAPPQSLEEALDAGWRIREELSSWGFKTANKRDGFLMLSRKGESCTLHVRFVAFYELHKPYFIS